jgi:hypothetical protein
MNADVWVTPRQPQLARSSTAQTSDREVVSPGAGPMTRQRSGKGFLFRYALLEYRYSLDKPRGLQ